MRDTPGIVPLPVTWVSPRSSAVTGPKGPLVWRAALARPGTGAIEHYPDDTPYPSRLTLGWTRESADAPDTFCGRRCNIAGARCKRPKSAGALSYCLRLVIAIRASVVTIEWTASAVPPSLADGLSQQILPERNGSDS